MAGYQSSVTITHRRSLGFVCLSYIHTLRLLGQVTSLTDSDIQDMPALVTPHLHRCSTQGASRFLERPRVGGLRQGS